MAKPKCGALPVGIAAVVTLVGVTAATPALATTSSSAQTPRTELTATPKPRVLQPTRPTSKFIPTTRCRAFPANSIWHADVSRLPAHPQTRNWKLSSDAFHRNLHPDFGPAYGEQPVPYGIPITIDRRPLAAAVPVRFGYAAESNRVPYPLSAATKIEGGSNARGDRHAIVIHAGTCRLYETWNTHRFPATWYAGSGAVWSLRSNALRPAGWTSADAAGLPILPGLLRWDEVVAGRVDHAIRFTVSTSQRAYQWPARHQAGSTTSPGAPPMGARFRLRANFNLASYSPRARVILVAMKRYGLIVADNGSNWYFQGTSDPRWPAGLISELKSIPAAAFDAVNVLPLRIAPNSGQAKR